MRIARGGGPFVMVPGLAVAAGALMASVASDRTLPMTLTAVALLVFFLDLWFFRDPERHPAPGWAPDVALSPADGVVAVSSQREGRPFMAVYLRLHDVHVIRAPAAMSASGPLGVPGAYRPAGGESTGGNQRVVCEGTGSQGDIRIEMVAGSVARRIVPYLRGGEDVLRGDRIGLIRFGSRVEVTFPAAFRLLVSEGERVLAGHTPVAVLTAQGSEA